jgi:hypothetical protein
MVSFVRLRRAYESCYYVQYCDQNLHCAHRHSIRHTATASRNDNSGVRGPYADRERSLQHGYATRSWNHGLTCQSESSFDLPIRVSSSFSACPERKTAPLRYARSNGEGFGGFLLLLAMHGFNIGADTRYRVQEYVADTGLGGCGAIREQPRLGI